MHRAIRILTLVSALAGTTGCQIIVGIKDTNPAAEDSSVGTDTSVDPGDTGTPGDSTVTDSGTDGDTMMTPGDTGPKICETAKRRCAGLLLQECNAEGSGWKDVETCKVLCLDGACSGTCKPGEVTCKADGKTPQVCDSAGGQLDLAPCPFACDAGKCVGECVPGTKGCNGKTPFTCDTKGKVVEATACASVCMDGACVDKCTAGSKQCNGTIPQTCDATGAWTDGTACPFVCTAGSCGGECSPGSKQCSDKTPQSCDATGKWVSAASACEFSCSSGECAGCKSDAECTTASLPICDTTSGRCVVCREGTKQCSGRNLQECVGAAWVDKTLCDYVCSGGACTGECVPGNKQCVGRDSQTCTAAGAWSTTTTCNVCSGAGVCSGVCVPGAKQCSGKTPQTCDASGNWVSGTTCAFDCSGGNCTTSCTSSTMCAPPTPECDTASGKCVDCLTHNACGGCGTLPGTVGAACGTNGCGAWTCQADKTLTCVGDHAKNSCGGCGTLSGGAVGTACGTYGCGTYQCDPANNNATTCQGDHATNACGGCGTLTGTTDDTCLLKGGGLGCTGCSADGNSIVCQSQPTAPGTDCSTSTLPCRQYKCYKGTTYCLSGCTEAGNVQCTSCTFIRISKCLAKGGTC